MIRSWKCAGSGLLLWAACAAAGAEWMKVQQVTAYNQVTLARENDAAHAVSVRIRNLEKIEDLRSAAEKALLGGTEAQALTREMLKGQTVWVEDLRVESGEKTAALYLSYEQVLRSFMKRRIAGGYTVNPELKKMLKDIYRQMLADLNSDTPSMNTIPEAKQNPSPLRLGAYGNDYDRAMFVYAALLWYKNTGQFLPAHVQRLFLEWVKSYQSGSPQDAKYLEKKLMDMINHHELYDDFLSEN
jgi:hypothetical protein